MAIHKSAYTGVFTDNHQEFVCDYLADIGSLPTQNAEERKCPTGSRAFVIEDSTKWVLNSSGEWVQIYSGGSGGGINDLNIATDEEVDSMLNDVF